MISNSNNSNKSYDIKCLYHPKQDIIYLCSDCGYGIRCDPACAKCVASNHQGHKLIFIDDDENQDLKLDLSINFINNILPQLNEQLENFKSLLNQSNQTYNEIENNHSTNKNKIIQEFKRLHNRLSLIELYLIKQLDLNLDKNKLVNSSITTTLQDRIKSTNQIINNNNGTDDQHEEDDDKNYQLIERINCEYKCRKSIVTNESIKNEYTHHELLLDQTLIDQFYNDSKSFLKLKKMKKTIKVSSKELTLYEDGDDIPDDNNMLAIKKGHHLPPHFPKSITFLVLPDEFDEPLNNLPDTIIGLCLFNIKSKLVKNSIPNRIRCLGFFNGFNQKITKEIIPSSVTELYIYDVLQPLNQNSIPNSVNKLIFDYGFKHIITKDIIPTSVTELHIYDVLQPLNDNSIPNSVNNLIFANGFKHIITKEIIPSSVTELYIYDVLQPLNNNSIPNSVTTLIFSYGFKHLITKDIIPSSVTELYLGNITQPLDTNSIPETIKTVYTYKSFKHSIKDILPKNVQHKELDLNK